MEFIIEKLFVPVLIAAIAFWLGRRKNQADINLADAGTGKAIVERAVLSAEKIDDLTDSLIEIKSLSAKLQTDLDLCLKGENCREARQKVKAFFIKIEHLFDDFDNVLKEDYEEIQKLLADR